MGFGELILVLLIVVLFFGASRLPGLGDGLGRAIRGFKGAMGEGKPAEKPAPKTPPQQGGA